MIVIEIINILLLLSAMWNLTFLFSMTKEAQYTYVHLIRHLILGLFQNEWKVVFVYF